MGSWKRRLVCTARWTLLADALVLASAAMLTVVPWPVWTQAMGTEAWPVGFVVPEIALWLVPLPVCFAAAALWLGRRRRTRADPRVIGVAPAATGVAPPGAGRNHHRWLTRTTVATCAAALILLGKPAVLPPRRALDDDAVRGGDPRRELVEREPAGRRHEAVAQ